MKNLSVTTFIHILFSIAISILITTFLLFLSWDRDRQKIDEFKHYQLLSIMFLSRLVSLPNESELKTLYKELKVIPVEKSEVKRLKEVIKKQGETIFSGGTALGQVKVYALLGVRYIYVQELTYNLMLKDNRKKSYFFEIAISTGIFLILVLLLLYIAILRKLYPLKTLHTQIDSFAKGNVNQHISYRYDDEIGKIAQNFDRAICHINELTNSKNLFMRNIMHELKTPITKGRIIAEMVKERDHKKVLINAFERMNELITELAQIERVTTGSFEPNSQEISLDALIRRTRELLLGRRDQVTIEVQDQMLFTDVKLFTLVLKNLMDNGIKYSRDHHVLLKSRGGVLEICSAGERLEHPLSFYLEPFSQEEKRSQGFGLGLYIVDTILKKLHYTLGYRYEKGQNIFTISLHDR